MKYLDFLRAQVRELCTNYGEIHGFWWDMNVPKHVDPSINAMIRQLQPEAVINNRGFDDGDFGTPERDYDQKSGEAAGCPRVEWPVSSAGNPTGRAPPIRLRLPSPRDCPSANSPEVAVPPGLPQSTRMRSRSHRACPGGEHKPTQGAA